MVRRDIYVFTNIQLRDIQHAICYATADIVPLLCVLNTHDDPPRYGLFLPNVVGITFGNRIHEISSKIIRLATVLRTLLRESRPLDPATQGGTRLLDDVANAGYEVAAVKSVWINFCRMARLSYKVHFDSTR
jgi:hypothetical protein